MDSFSTLQISGWTQAMPEMIITHLFGKVDQVEYSKLAFLI